MSGKNKKITRQLILIFACVGFYNSSISQDFSAIKNINSLRKQRLKLH